MVTRRDFLKTVAAAGTASLAQPSVTRALPGRSAADHFAVHPFVESNPDAVFIMRTNVPDKYDAVAKKNAGLDFGRSVFVPSDASGIPITNKIVVKGNLKTANPDRYDHDLIMSHTSDAIFTEGILEGMKELGIEGGNIYLREVNRPEDFSREPFGYAAMCERVGASLRLDLSPTVTNLKEGDDYTWVDVPDGQFYFRMPYLEPINTPGSWLMNISKFKAHGMCLTLCTKNLQGCVVHNYQQFCADYKATMSVNPRDIRGDAYDVIKANFDRHLEMGVPRWDKPGTNFNSGIGMETWVTRTLDNLSVTPTGLHIIEGIYGRDGQGNNDVGPNPTDQPHTFNATGVSTTGKAWDWMSNIIVFGKDPYRVDIIGHWLGGHEPGNVGLFHCAIDRGMSDALDPSLIPVYEWKADGTATRMPLTSFEQTPLLTYYLCRNYDGQTEHIYHLCNEPFDYGTVTGVAQPAVPERPEAAVLDQNFPNPFNPYTAISYGMPEAGHARLEVFNSAGQLVDVLVDGYRQAGSHMATWNANGSASGTYFYRFRFNGHSLTRKMTLVR